MGDDIVFGPRLPDSINHYHIIPSKNILDPILGDGGAWGINPTPGSTLMKIIEDQQWMQKSSSQGFNEKKDLGNKLKQPPPPPIPLPIPPPPPCYLMYILLILMWLLVTLVL